MVGEDLLESCDRSSRLYDRYTTAATEALDTDERVQAALREWDRFVRESHGDVFRDVDRAREQLFVDTLYYDFVVDCIVDSVERSFDVTLCNREASVNTDVLSVDFGALHDRIVDTASAGHVVDDHLDTTAVRDVDSGFLRELYERIVSREMRLQLGQYYTPRGLAELAVSELSVDDWETDRVLDPGCGSGIFLLACIDAKRRALEDDLSAEALVDTITDTVYGIDLNPVAVKSAKLAYLLALVDLVGAAGVDDIEVPVFLTDALQFTDDADVRFRDAPASLCVDHLVGNPPWITWSNLTESVKDAWRETYIQDLDLFPHRGIESRLGHGNDDVSVPFVWVCIHHYLAEDGDASVVCKRDIMKGPAGELFRSQRVDGRPVAVRHIHDFDTLQPFDDVGAYAAIYTLTADADPSFPIPVDAWTQGETAPSFDDADSLRETLHHETTAVVPVEADDPASSWVRTDAERRALGECAHRIWHGLKDDAKAVYGIDRDQLSDIEPEYVYPYLKSRHVVKYGLFGYDLHLVPMEQANEDNEATLRDRAPQTYEYLHSHRQRLEDRSSTWLDEGPFYNVFGLGEYTWSEYKVVWCRLGYKPHFAVVSTVDDEDLGEKPVVPGDHCMFVATDDEYEAHFLCGLLNSAVYQRSLGDVSSGGKSSLSKTVVSKLHLPEYRGTPESERLAELSMAAHDVVPEHTDVSKRAYNQQTIPELAAIQTEIDELVEGMLADGARGAVRPPSTDG